MDKLISILKSLSDETRLRILNLLYEKELCVCEVMEVLHISQAKASRHLLYLKNSGLVKDRKKAQWIYYSIVKEQELNFLDSLIHNNLRGMEPYKEDLKNLSELNGSICSV